MIIKKRRGELEIVLGNLQNMLVKDKDGEHRGPRVYVPKEEYPDAIARLKE